MILEGLYSAIEAREHKVKTKNQKSRLDNARSHYKEAMNEIVKGFHAIEEFDKEVN